MGLGWHDRATGILQRSARPRCSWHEGGDPPPLSRDVAGIGGWAPTEEGDALTVGVTEEGDALTVRGLGGHSIATLNRGAVRRGGSPRGAMEGGMPAPWGLGST